MRFAILAHLEKLCGAANWELTRREKSLGQQES
jgi:hypothetical protein